MKLILLVKRYRRRFVLVILSISGSVNSNISQSKGLNFLVFLSYEECNLHFTVIIWKLEQIGDHPKKFDIEKPKLGTHSLNLKNGRNDLQPTQTVLFDQSKVCIQVHKKSTYFSKNARDCFRKKLRLFDVFIVFSKTNFIPIMHTY